MRRRGAAPGGARTRAPAWAVWGVALGVVGACAQRPIRYPPSQPVLQTPTPDPAARAASNAESNPPPAPSAVAVQPTPEHVFEPARLYIKTTNLSLYSYHTKRIGNVEGYLAPILHTSDGGFLVVGTRRPPGPYRVGVSQPVVAKLDATGAKQWDRSYRRSGFLDFEGASAVEVAGGYIIYILSYVHPARGSVARLVRLDPAGNTLWDTRLRGDGRAGTPFPQNVRLVDALLILDGHIYKDASETAYGWSGSVSLEGSVLSDEVGAANPY